MDDALQGPTSDARRAHARGEWQAAFDGFVAAGPTDAFTGDDLRAFADSAWWLGRMTESLDAYVQANRRYVAEGRPTDAAMAAFYMGLHTSLRGDIANGNAWLRRCDQLLAELALLANASPATVRPNWTLEWAQATTTRR